MIAKFALLVTAVLASAAARADEPGTAELQKCKICHALDAAGGNRVGPDLHGVFGRKAGTAAGFAFSDAMKDSGIIWDDETLAKFLRDPKGSLPGNRMSFPGIQNEATLRDLLQQLKQATQ
ncbi:MAG TPA: c-type cytochrome [Stellaceae bacterium]|nr:c-type cytochrome [Stellaceae bacterium]